MLPVISFIVPVRNDAARLRRCLETMQTPISHEIVVIDNGSTDGSADAARSVGARVIELPGVRVSSMRNAGARVASGELLAFVDADHELGPGWADAAATLFVQERDVVAAGAPYHAPPDGTWVQRMYDRLRRRQVGRKPTDWLPSGNLVVRRASFDAVDGFDTTLETCEDVDLCQRLVARGGTILECDGLVSVHRGDPRTLRALFLGELWRGRDNVRVTLRGPLSFRSLPSLLLPAMVLLGAGGIMAGLVAWPLWPQRGWLLTAAGVGTLGTVAIARALSLWGRIGQRDRTGRAAVEAILVGSVYDAARALALVARPSHEIRRRG